jgi:hypothetical protein
MVSFHQFAFGYGQKPGEGDLPIDFQPFQRCPRVLLAINVHCDLRSSILLAVPAACDRRRCELVTPDSQLYECRSYKSLKLSYSVPFETFLWFTLHSRIAGNVNHEHRAPNLTLLDVPTAYDRGRQGRGMPNLLAF